MKPIRLFILLVGDIIVLGLITLFGFATHNELGSAGLRMFTTFIPLLAAWLLLSPPPQAMINTHLHSRIRVHLHADRDIPG